MADWNQGGIALTAAGGIFRHNQTQSATLHNSFNRGYSSRRTYYNNRYSNKCWYNGDIMSSLNVNTISEYTSANGVTIDGVKLKDNAVETNTISEGTSGSGVTIDSVLLKDGVAHSGLVKLSSATASNSADITFDNFVDNSVYAAYMLYIENHLVADDGTNLDLRFRTSAMMILQMIIYLLTTKEKWVMVQVQMLKVNKQILTLLIYGEVRQTHYQIL